MVVAAAPKKSRKPRKKLVASKTEQALRRRGRELLGLALIAVSAAFFTLLWTYDPGDPSLFSATGEAPKNALGLLGASLADPLYRALGWAAFGLPAVLMVWGGRFVTHRGDERAPGRTVLTPMALAFAAVFASAHVPPDGWDMAYGLGGIFGDTVLRALLDALPADLSLGLKSVTVVLGAATLLLSGYVLGIDGPEFRAIGRFLGRGLIHAYVVILQTLGIVGRGARGAAAVARDQHTRRTAERARRQELPETSGDTDAGQPPDTPDHPGAEHHRWSPQPYEENEARLMARISAAVQARGGAPAGADGGIDLQPEVSPDAAPPKDLIVPKALPEDRLGPVDAAPLKKFFRNRAESRVKAADKPRSRKSSKAREEEQPELALEDAGREGYRSPALSLLENPKNVVRSTPSVEALEENARMLESVLDDYGVKGEIVSVKPGPVVTMYELEPAPGLKASRVIGLADDIARSMSALAARVSTIPGRSIIGIELPNAHRERVLLREILSSRAYGDSTHKLPLALGKDIAGEPVVANLARMPHLLIAGTTGSGKSVAINTMVLSLLYHLSPDECRLIMIDPKMLELSVYDGIPHLLSPVVTDPRKAVVALKWVVAEMEERYRKMSKLGVRNIDGYNARVEEALGKNEAFTRTVQTGFDDATGDPVFESEEFQPETMPFIVVVVDEMADLMMVAGKEIEACIQRLAQMARASGIHLIMATQRPSVDVITGTIKANFPTRISFQVTSKVDSRTILGEMGAEQLLGMGDMLFMAGGGRITRVHGPFVADEEVEEVVRFLKSQGEPDYVPGVQDGPDGEAGSEIDLVLGLGGGADGEDALYDQAVAIVIQDRKCSTSYIQRKLSIGYNKAAKIVEQMEEQGVVSQANHVGKREVLVPER
ncbi:MAG: DNA translocase FtsK [Paracoccaceae bacterium]